MVQWLRLHISIAGVLGLTPSWETDILHAGLVWPSKKKKSTLKYIVMELRIPWTARRSNQSILKEIIGRTDVEAEASILWPPNAKDWLTGKNSDVGKDWRQEEKGITEDEMVEWHHQLDGHEFEQALGVGDGQGSLASFQSMGSQSQTPLSDWIDWLTHPNK